MWLTAKAFAGLCYLVEHAGQLVTKDALFAAVWASAYVSEAALAVCIGEIRRALGDAARMPQYLETVRRRGYRFVAPVTVPPSSPEPAVAERPQPMMVTRPGLLVGREAELTELQQRWAQAMQRSAHQEAIRHLTQALELLTTLPDTPERAEHELAVQVALGPALMASKGYTAPDVVHTYTRALTLCQQSDESPHRFAVLRSLRRVYAGRAEMAQAQAMGEALLALAERSHNAGYLLEAHLGVGTNGFIRRTTSLMQPPIKESSIAVSQKPNRKKQERYAFGLTILHPGHAEIRRLQHEAPQPSLHGHKVWRSSFLLIDYLQQRSSNTPARVLEVGCGWGLVGIYCAKTCNAQVMAVDADAAVFPYLKLHAQLNGVSIQTRQLAFAHIHAQELTAFDLIVGSDICFWDELVDPLYDLVRLGVKTGIKEILLADPGRPPFDELCTRCQQENTAEMIDWEIKKPFAASGTILRVVGSA